MHEIRTTDNLYYINCSFLNIKGQDIREHKEEFIWSSKDYFWLVQDF